MGTSHPHLLQSPQKLSKDQAGMRQSQAWVWLPRQHSWKASACQCSTCGDACLIPGSGRGDGGPLQCSCLERPMGRRTWRATGHGAAKSLTPERLSGSNSRFASGVNQLTILRLSFLNLQTWLNDGDLRKLVTIKWHLAHEAVSVMGTERFTQQMKSAFISAHGDACPLVSWQEEAGGGSSPPLLQVGGPGGPLT